MAAGISPYKTVTISLGEYSADHYLVLLYHAMENRDWRIGYFDHDGIIAYTGISWSSYSEEVSARVVDNSIVIKSECVGYQALFTDYGKNAENIALLLGEIEYAEVRRRYNVPLIMRVTKLTDTAAIKKFMEYYTPSFEDLKGWNDYELIKETKKSFDYYEKHPPKPVKDELKAGKSESP